MGAQTSVQVPTSEQMCKEQVLPQPQPPPPASFISQPISGAESNLPPQPPLPPAQMQPQPPPPPPPEPPAPATSDDNQPRATQPSISEPKRKKDHTDDKWEFRSRSPSERRWRSPSTDSSHSMDRCVSEFM